MSDMKFTKDHEWVLESDGVFKVGVTQFAQEQLGDVVYVECPEVGLDLNKGDAFGTIESVKAVSDLFAPIDGKVVEINEKLEDSPELINESPEGEGWIITLKANSEIDLSGLMSLEEYNNFKG